MGLDGCALSLQVEILTLSGVGFTPPNSCTFCKMAPLCVAGRLLLLQWLMFLLFITFGTNQVASLLVYDCQALLDLRNNLGELCAFKHSGQKTVPPLLAGIPTYLCRASAPPPRRKCPRHRGKRGGQLVKLKVWLAQSSSISRKGHGRIHPFAMPRCFLDPIDACFVPVTGSFEGLRPRHTCPPRLSQRSVNLWLLKTLPQALRSAELKPRYGLVNARSLVNKTFILRDFFNSRGLDFLCVTETWIGVGECSPLIELLPAGCSYFNSRPSSPRSWRRDGDCL